MKHDLTGQKIGNYRIVQLIGVGGFASVYLGEHLYLQRKVAIKVLHSQLVAKDEEQRFLHEAQLIARLGHPHIVAILDFGVEQGTPYLVMDYAEHKSIRHRYPKKFVLPLNIITIYVQQIAEALQYAHDNGVIHRDVKPENMLIKADDHIVLSDFGIATTVSTTDSQTEENIAGTIAYMAPEQIQGKPVRASDQYALGIVIYEWLCGSPPFQGVFTELVMQHLTTTPPSLRVRQPKLSPEVEQVVMKALSKEPEQRFGTMFEFAQAFNEAAQKMNASDLPSYTVPDSTINEEEEPSASNSVFDATEEDEEQLPPYSIFDAFEEDALASDFATGKDDARLIWPHARSAFEPGVNAAGRPAAGGPVTGGLVSGYREIDYKDFFISYHKADRAWARWIKWQLDKAGYSTVLLPWGINTHSDVEVELTIATTYAERVICVVSQKYFAAFEHLDQFFAVLQHKHSTISQQLLPISVQGLEQGTRQKIDTIKHIDVSEEDEASALELLLAGVSERSIDLTTPPVFPGVSSSSAPTFPGQRPEASLASYDENAIATDAITSQTRIKTTSHEQETSAHNTDANASALNKTVRSLEVFFSYSHKDEELRLELEKYLSNLKRERAIRNWYDGEISAGKEWASEIDRHLRQADIILLLISQDFIASDYCYDKEMMRALERHKHGEACVIPIILRPTHWEVTPFRKLQALPAAGKPITMWQNRDEAFLNVAQGIQKVVEKWIENSRPNF